jgi:hypothetical protein
VQSSYYWSDSTFQVLNNAPNVFLSDPTEQASFSSGQLIFFEAAAYDKEDGQISGAGLQWTSDIDGSIGEGKHLNLNSSDLSEGYHAITITATDSEGLTQAVSINIAVLGSDTDGIPDSSDNCPLNCNTQQLDADGDGIGDVCDLEPGCGGCCDDPVSRNAN